MEKALRNLPIPRENPIRDMDRLLDSFDHAIGRTIDIDKFKNPPLLKTCRSRLDAFVDTLVYHLCPRFVPGSEKKRQGVYKEFYATSARVPRPDTKVKAPRMIYLDEVIRKAKYVLSKFEDSLIHILLSLEN
jgi:hypothetical protein